MRSKSAGIGMFLFILVGSLLSAPVFAAFPSDGYPHYGKALACNDHVSNPQPLGAATPQKFTLCKGTSGATSWFAAVYKINTGTPACTYGSQSQPITASSPQTYNCNLPAGTYRAYIYYWVGSSQMMTKCDQYFTVP
jgi:hypothetical protein